MSRKPAQLGKLKGQVGAMGGEHDDAGEAGLTKLPAGKPSAAQLRYLLMGLESAGGKLPLFDSQGQEISHKTIRSCIEHGWAQPWFANPAKPDWLVCRLTANGRMILAKSA